MLLCLKFCLVTRRICEKNKTKKIMSKTKTNCLKSGVQTVLQFKVLCVTAVVSVPFFSAFYALFSKNFNSAAFSWDEFCGFARFPRRR